MASLTEALQYPTEHDDWVRTVLIGGVLTLFSFLLVPILPVYGYLVRTLRASFAGEPEPPTFGEWEELFVDGGKAFVIGLVYMILPMVVGLVTVGGAIVAFTTGFRGGAAVGITGLAVGVVLFAVLSLVFGYVAVAGVVNFAREREFAAGFDFGTLKTVVFHGDFAVAWLLSVVVFVGAGILAGAFNAVPVLGTVAGAFLGFYALVVAARLLADGYSAARGVDLGTERPDVEEPVV